MRELSGPFRFQQQIYIHLNHVANGQNVNMPVPVKTLRFFCEPLLNSLTHRFIRRFYNNLDLSTGNRVTDNLSPRSGCLLYVAIVATTSHSDRRADAFVSLLSLGTRGTPLYEYLLITISSTSGGNKKRAVPSLS